MKLDVQVGVAEDLDILHEHSIDAIEDKLQGLCFYGALFAFHGQAIVVSGLHEICQEGLSLEEDHLVDLVNPTAKDFGHEFQPFDI